METKIEKKIINLDNGIKLSPDAIAEILYLQKGIYPGDDLPDINDIDGGINEYNEHIQEAMNHIVLNAAGTGPVACKEAISVLEGLRAVYLAFKSFRVISEGELKIKTRENIE